MMHSNDIKSLFKILFQTVSFVIFIAISSSISAETQQYQNTINALQTRYADEINAHREYGLYAQKAQEEGYPHVAHLFRSLAASEAIHAKNFKRTLKELGQEIIPPLITDIEISMTKEHLKHATTVEAEEIDREYPVILERILSENHQAAIENITFAWESEKQHRDLIVKIQEAISNWFRLVISRIEGRSAHYYVCQVCGSTLTEVPQNHCPICNHPAENYLEVLGFPKVKKAPGNIFGLDH
jgi:rubrerythrin